MRLSNENETGTKQLPAHTKGMFDFDMEDSTKKMWKCFKKSLKKF